jgi:hypothetical protein
MSPFQIGDETRTMRRVEPPRLPRPAIDAEAFDEPENLAWRAKHHANECLASLRPEHAQHLVGAHARKARDDQPAIAPRGAMPDRHRLQHHDALAGLRRRQRRREAMNAAANDGNIDIDVPDQRGIARRLPRRGGPKARDSRHGWMGRQRDSASALRYLPSFAMSFVTSAVETCAVVTTLPPAIFHSANGPVMSPTLSNAIGPMTPT